MDIQIFIQNIGSWIMSRGIKIVLILVIVFVVSKIGRKLIEKIITRIIEYSDKGAGIKRKNTLVKIFSGVLYVLIWLIAIMLILSKMGISIVSLLTGLGVLGFAIGFGFQSLVRDLLAGFFIIMENQYRVGDIIALDNDKITGIVEEITLRKTVIRDLDGKVHHVSNSSFSLASNLTSSYSGAHINIKVAYKENVDKVIELINKVGKEMTEVSPWKEDILEPIQVLGTGPNDFLDSGIEIKALGKTKTMKQWNVLREFRRRLKIAFDKQKIEFSSSKPLEVK